MIFLACNTQNQYLNIKNYSAYLYENLSVYIVLTYLCIIVSALSSLYAGSTSIG